MSAIAAAVAGCALFQPAPALVLTAENAEIVIAEGASGMVDFAARELATFLGEALGTTVPIRKVDGKRRWTGDGKVSIVLGDNAWSREAGIDVSKLPRDGFVTKTFGGRLFISGRDDPKGDIKRMLANNWGYQVDQGEHATLFGVYAFLEDCAGCRFFFPGECGTVVPKTEKIAVKPVDKTTAPVFTVRNPYIRCGGVLWPAMTDKMTAEERDDVRRRDGVLTWLRLRLQSESLSCCHGQNGFYYLERFGKTHPEYFSRFEDGTRDLAPSYKGSEFHWTIRHLCHTSKVWDEMYEDAKAFLTGQDAATRGIPSRRDKTKFGWNQNCQVWNGERIVDIMPQDGSRLCCCTNCAKLDIKVPANESELMWGNTAKLANRLKAEGVKGSVTMMAYGSYGVLPKVDIPDNVRVMVAQTGPWSVRDAKRLRGELDHYRAWMEKTHGKVWIWTYPHKWEATAIPDVPCMAPRAWGRYYQKAAPYIFGSFAECETDRAIFNYLNAYVFAKIGWNPKLDLDALLDDHYAKMFGKGAAEMKRFYEEMEDAWFRVLGDIYWDNIGPHVTVPSVYTIATDIYSPARLRSWSKLCDEAIRKNAGDPAARKRVEFMRQQFIVPLAARFKGYVDSVSAEKGLAKRASRPAAANLLRNGGCESLENWAPVWEGETKLELDDKTFMTGRHSIRVTATQMKRHSYMLQYCTFKPGTKYRVSYFQKLKDVKTSNRNGGVYCEYFDGDWHWFPNKVRPMSGTTDWVYREYEFQTDAQPKKKDRNFFRFMFSGACGTVWFDDVRIEELPPDAVLAEERDW